MRVGQAMEILTSGGRRVYWVGNPIMRDARYGDTIAMMNKIYEAEARQHQGVTYVDTWRLLSDEKGRFAEYLPDESGDMVLMRQPDGIHLTAPAATAWRGPCSTRSSATGACRPSSARRRRGRAADVSTRAHRMPVPSSSSTQSRVTTSQNASPAKLAVAAEAPLDGGVGHQRAGVPEAVRTWAASTSRG